VDLSVTFAANARGIRAARGMRQQDVADRAGILRSTLSLIEGGGRRITLEDVLAVCTGLGVTLDELLAGADPEHLRTIGLRRAAPEAGAQPVAPRPPRGTQHRRRPPRGSR
jgi:transcriptional regulator with XRE-family HTH domain